MLCFICKKLSLVSLNSKASPFSHGFCLSKLFLRPISEMSTFTDPQIFTVSYLQNSCGLSQNSAIAASKKLLIENSEKADSVLKLMRTHGLTQTHIEKIIATRPTLLLDDLEGKLRPNVKLLDSLGFSGDSLGKLLIRKSRLLHSDIDDTIEFFRGQGFTDKQITILTMKCPSLLRFNANNNLKPKLDFLKSIGFTDEAVSSHPFVLQSSLENHIIPCFQVLKRILVTNEKVLKAVKANNWLLRCNLEKILEPNILILKSHGVSQPIILRMLMTNPRTLLLRPQQTTEIFAKVMILGFDPNTMLFVVAFRSMAFSKTLWERKLEAYKSFGLSEDEVYSAFKMQPMCMLISEKKIKKMMNFFINKLNVESSVICRYPNLLMLSLEKRITPRCSVLQLLMSTGFMKEDVKLVTLFGHLTMTEEKFVENLVRKYQEVLPDVVKGHEGKIKFEGLPVSFKL